MITKRAETCCFFFCCSSSFFHRSFSNSLAISRALHVNFVGFSQPCAYCPLPLSRALALSLSCTQSLVVSHSLRKETILYTLLVFVGSLFLIRFDRPFLTPFILTSTWINLCFCPLLRITLFASPLLTLFFFLVLWFFHFLPTFLLNSVIF